MTAGQIGGQALAAGVVDEVSVALVPVVFGTGVRFFGDFAEGPRLLQDPYRVIQGDRVLLLDFRVRH